MKDIINRCLGGDEGAWDELIEKCSPLVTSTIYRTFNKYTFAPAIEDVDDLHNGLFLSLMENNFRKLRQFKGEASFFSYIRVIAVRQVIDFLRQQKKHLSLDSDDIPEPLVCNAPLPDSKVEQAQLINKVMEALSPSEKLLLRLIYEKGLSPKEVSGIMNISAQVFYTKKSRVKKKIKEILKEIGG